MNCFSPIIYRMNSIPIIYENDQIIIINKPVGLASQGGQGITASVDVDLSNQINQKVYLVHRLDKETSGLMIVAKNPSAATLWTNRIGTKEIIKEYYALCCGNLKSKTGTISEPIMQKGIEKNAITQYQVEKESIFNNISFSLLKLRLDTGRMHQIRIHLAQQMAPIAGDDKYGNFKLNKELKKELGIKRLHLASVKLTIPSLGTFEIPLPEHMEKTAQSIFSY